MTRFPTARRSAYPVAWQSMPGLAAVVAAAATAVPAAAFASADTSLVVGHVYVDDNTARGEYDRGV